MISKEEFTRRFFAAVVASRLTPDEIAGPLKTGTPTVARWMTGTSAPHWVARKSVLQAMERLAKGDSF